MISNKRELYKGFALFVIAAVAAMMLFASPAWAQDLRLDKEDSPDPVEEGELLRFTIQVRNTSNVAVMDGFTVTDRLPEDVRVVSVVTSEPAECTVDERDRNVRCVFEDGLAIAGTDGDRATVRITVEPTATGELKNEATVTPEVSAQDTNTNNNTDETTTDVQAAPENNQNPDAPVVVIIDDDGNSGDGDGGEEDEGDNDGEEEDEGDNDGEEEDNNEADANGDGVISSQEQEAADAENELNALEETNGEVTNGEGTNGDDLNDDSPVSATSENGQAEASTPGAVARSGGDPDEQAPVSQQQAEQQYGGEVVDEIPTEGPLPETGGASVATGTSLALVLFGVLLLALRLISGRRQRL